MKKTRIFIGIAAIIIFIIGAVVIAANTSGGEPQAVPASETSDTTSASATYTMAQVATHKSAASCWSVIRGGVYDLTSWINKHPGGPEAILGICGIEATAQFDEQHKGQGKPEQALTSFKIGVIK